MTPARNPAYRDWQHQPETFYALRRQIDTMMQLARDLELAGYHHLERHAKAMQLAHATAQRALLYNDPPGALKALGAFWNIHRGYLEEEPAFDREGG